MQNDRIIAAIDSGGTSFKCALIRGDGHILEAWTVPTTTPDDTLTACMSSFERSEYAPVALGIASFGPIEIDPNARGYGTITGTAKPGWNGVALGPRLSQGLGLPFYLDTDVNAALLAEMRWGVGQEQSSAAYLTVGTGIGLGLYLNGALVGRPAHPEFGHIRVERHRRDLDFKGVCAIHGDCLEGLASAPAMQARWGHPEQLPRDHIGWEIEAYYLAQACLTLYLTTRLDRIILGGGLMQAEHLLHQVQSAFDRLMGDYLPVRGADALMAPGLGAHSGVLGGAIVALNALS
ncbi:MAG: ROK family protein [Pseudomonadota bacterium]